jgi:hypothetical protein
LYTLLQHSLRPFASSLGGQFATELGGQFLRNIQPILQKELKNEGVTSYRVAILGGLEEISLQKTFHINPHKVGLFYGYSYSYSDKYPDKKRDSINTSLRLLLEKIKKAGLLTDRVYAYTLKDIDTGHYFADVQLIGQLREMSSRLEWLSPDKLLPVAEVFHKNGIVSDSSFQQLETDIKNEKIESAFQLNDYCKLDRTFSIRKYPDDPGAWLEQVHRDIASILPGLNFTDFSYTTIADTDKSFGSQPETKFRISLTCNGHVYKHTTVALTFKGRQGNVNYTDFPVLDFYRIFNKILADQQSPFRLHNIMLDFAGEATGDTRRSAIIALTEEQMRVFMEKPSMNYMLASLDDYDNTLTSIRVDTTIAEWRKIGLFSHLSEAEIEKGIENAEAGDLYSMDNLLVNFPGVAYRLDPPLVGQHNVYPTLLNHLADLTHGEFKPTKITQKKVKGGVKMQYLCNRKIHSYLFKTTYGSFDARFPAFMKHLANENNLQGNFYPLRHEDALIYLTNRQYIYIVKHKLLGLDTVT